MKKLIQYYDLFYVSEIIQSKQIGFYYNEVFTNNFGGEKIERLISNKYYYSTSFEGIESYMKAVIFVLFSKQYVISDIKSFYFFNINIKI